MFTQINLKKTMLALMVLGLFIGCAGNTGNETASVPSALAPGQYLEIGIDTLGLGTEIQYAGLQLMENPLGMIHLSSEGQYNDSVLVVAVHGYQSRGYEWITGLKNLTTHFGSLYFYRYDWDLCPDQIALSLAAEINSIYQAGNYKRVLMFSHSYGGVVATLAVSSLGNLNVESHVIAAPLVGFNSLLDKCTGLKYDASQTLVYPTWSNSVRVIQHRTVHVQDGAFRDMELDPQVIDLPFQKVQELPPTMDGHRLGHNWSVTWVLDQYVGKPHRH